MSAFYRDIAGKIAVPYKRLSIVRNLDGFLSDPEVQRALTAESGFLFVSGSPLSLRLHFELQYKVALEAYRHSFFEHNLMIPRDSEVSTYPYFELLDL